MTAAEVFVFFVLPLVLASTGWAAAVMARRSADIRELWAIYREPSARSPQHRQADARPGASWVRAVLAVVALVFWPKGRR